ncbi:MAG: response regulator transcription factor [Dehalococcoidia bacterium]|nr:response regulator transcription factor [Dehalococcoidia bacterium]
MKVLIIEDDLELVESVSLAFQIVWPEIQVSSTHLGKKGLELVKGEVYNIIILDLELPDMNSFEVLEKIRYFSTVPIIVLTANVEESDVMKALERGADDYIIKPFGQIELLLKVKARIYNDTRFSQEPPSSFGPLSFNPSTRQPM